MIVNKLLTYLTCTYLENQKEFYCEIFNILFSYEDQNIDKHSNLHLCIFTFDGNEYFENLTKVSSRYEEVFWETKIRKILDNYKPGQNYWNLFQSSYFW